jgi:hypothetical protein
MFGNRYILYKLGMWQYNDKNEKDLQNTTHKTNPYYIFLQTIKVTRSIIFTPYRSRLNSDLFKRVDLRYTLYKYDILILASTYTSAK